VSPLTLSATTTVKAKTFHPDYATSAETARTYTIRTQTPQLTTGSGSYAPGTTVTITSPDPAATLRITLNGVDPTSTDAPIDEAAPAGHHPRANTTGLGGESRTRRRPFENCRLLQDEAGEVARWPGSWVAKVAAGHRATQRPTYLATCSGLIYEPAQLHEVVRR
jgi:hypothetical protein